MKTTDLVKLTFVALLVSALMPFERPEHARQAASAQDSTHSIMVAQVSVCPQQRGRCGS